MCNHHHDDQHCHPDPDEARGHIKRRIDGRVPTAYPTTAAVLGFATCAAWGILIYSGVIHRAKPLTYGSAVCLAFVVALTIAASVATSIWLRTRRDYARAKEDTIIGEYWHHQLIQEIHAEGDEAAKEFIQSAQQLVNGHASGMDGGNVRNFSRRGG